MGVERGRNSFEDRLELRECLVVGADFLSITIPAGSYGKPGGGVG